VSEQDESAEVPPWDEPVRYHRHVPANPATLRVEPGRLERARKLWCVPLGGRRYAVQGSREIQWIDMMGEEPCYCEDALLDDGRWVCKHILRAHIEEGHPLVMATLAQLQAASDQRNRWAHNPFVED
jgi:hypothetical protein